MKDLVFSTLDDLGLSIHPTKGFHVHVQIADHLGLTIDLEKGEFRATESKLRSIAVLEKTLLFQASANLRW